MSKAISFTIFILFAVAGCATYNLDQLSPRSRSEFIQYRSQIEQEVREGSMPRKNAREMLDTQYMSLQARDQEDFARWWNSLSPQERAAYIQADAMRRQQILQLYGTCCCSNNSNNGRNSNNGDYSSNNVNCPDRAHHGAPGALILMALGTPPATDCRAPH